MKLASALAVALLFAIAAPACSRGGGASKDVPFVEIDPSSKSTTDIAINKAQKKLRANPNDAGAALALADAFLQKARETADPSLYTKAGQLLDELSASNGGDVRVIVSQATLALARHQFVDGLALGKRALAAAPGNEAAFGVVVDASNELGLYPAALDATQDMVDSRPNLSSLSRVSYTRELRGDYPGAILAMTQAIAAAGTTTGENIAYVQVQLGNLLLTTGQVRQASTTFATALEAFPNFPAAMVGQANVLVAQERFRAAADLLQKVIDIQPLDTYAIALGDARAAAGQAAAAKEAYALVKAIAKLYEANGVNVELELALYDADHTPGKRAVANARKALKLRPSILGHDVLSWNLFRDGQLAEAARERVKALATGTKDPLLRFHAAAIAAANGDRAAATADLKVVLSENPRFSAFLISEVKALARTLGLTMPPPAA